MKKTIISSVYYVIWGTIGGSLIVLGAFLLHSRIDSNLNWDFLPLIFSIIGILSFCVLIGIAITQLCMIPITNFFDKQIKHFKESISEYSTQSKWPGRRFMELLRRTSLGSTKREFLTLGMDVSLRIPADNNKHTIERLLSSLFIAELEAKNRSQTDLVKVAKKASGLLQNLVDIIRLKVAAKWFLYYLIPSVMAYYGSIIFESMIESQNYHISDFVYSLIFLGASIVIVYVVGQILYIITWRFSKRTRTEIDNVFLMILSWFIAGVLGITSIYFSLIHSFNWPEAIKTSFRITALLLLPKSPVEELKLLPGITASKLLILRISVILLTTTLFIIMLRNLCQRVFRGIAERTEQKYDDMVVELVRIFGTFLIGALGLGWIFMVVIAYLGEISATGGSSELLPYAIIVSIFGAILGIGSRDLLENFFAGVSLQVDKPFERGERILFESGQVCEVRSIGMRSTHFFNISDNTDLYCPNTVIAKQNVTNLSRPDREHRRILKIFVVDKKDSLYEASTLILLGAYSVEGIDIPTIIDENYEKSMFYKNRRGIVAEFLKLQEHYDEAASASIKFHGKYQPIGDLVRELCKDLSSLINQLNENRDKRWSVTLGKPLIDFKKNSMTLEQTLKQAELAHMAAYKFHELATCFYTLSASYPSLREQLEHLILELLRAPRVRSSHKITEDGVNFWEIELLVYAQLTEESDQILHHLDIFIQSLLEKYNLIQRFTLKSKKYGEQNG